MSHHQQGVSGEEILLNEMSQMMKAEFMQLHKRINKIEANRRQHQHSPIKSPPWRDDDDDANNKKMKFPTFLGKSDPEAYFLWKERMEIVFNCHNYSKLRKARLASFQFSDYANTWWDQLLKDRRRNGERQVET